MFQYINATAINEKRGNIFEREKDEVYGRVWREKRRKMLKCMISQKFLVFIGLNFLVEKVI